MNMYFQGSSQAEIRKSYRKLSLILHPDKETGNEKAFMKLTKGDIFVCYSFLKLMVEIEQSPYMPRQA
jgi:DnaJ-class molecular chaperone with C-terminal Zn finger domain